jgi:multiple sugar transport system ATP-binding protein
VTEALSAAVRIPLRRLPLPRPLAPGRSVVLGIRPEDPRLGDEDDGVRVVPTGPEVRLERDQAVRVSADPHHTHVFDAETEEALR